MNHLQGPAVATRPPGLLILVFLCGCKYAPSSGLRFVNRRCKGAIKRPSLLDSLSPPPPPTSTMNRTSAHAHASATESKRDKKRREIIEKVEKQHAEKIQSFQQYVCAFPDGD
jgi:hypothetical protein